MAGLLLLLFTANGALAHAVAEGDKGYIQGAVVNKTPHVIVKAKEGNVRSGPTTKDAVVGKSVRDVIFVKVEQKGDWVKVSHPDLTGWVHKDLVWP